MGRFQSLSRRVQAVEHRSTGYVRSVRERIAADGALIDFFLKATLKYNGVEITPDEAIGQLLEMELMRRAEYAALEGIIEDGDERDREAGIRMMWKSEVAAGRCCTLDEMRERLDAMARKDRLQQWP
jgi:hypothetical protein